MSKDSNLKSRIQELEKRNKEVNLVYRYSKYASWKRKTKSLPKRMPKMNIELKSYFAPLLSLKGGLNKM
jgi:hypothetical protein